MLQTNNEISVGEFVILLMDTRRSQKNISSEENLSLQELLRYGHFRLWLDDIDERHPEAPLNRQSAARIIHNFLRIECGIADIQDTSSANCLKDLYTCRVCANHIAQVYVRGIMEAQEYENQTLIFNHLEIVSKSESDQILERIRYVINE